MKDTKSSNGGKVIAWEITSIDDEELELDSRKPEGPQDRPEAPKKFEFITGPALDATSRRRIKKHVMDNYMSKRRSADYSALRRSTVSRPLPWRRRESVSVSDIHLLKAEHESQSTSTSTDDSTSSDQGSARQQSPGLGDLSNSSTYGDSEVLPAGGAGRLLTVAGSPQTNLGAGRVDPFVAYPIDCGQWDHALLDYYISALGPRMFRFQTLVNRMVSRFYFNQAMQDPAAFHLLIAYSALHSSTIQGRGPTPEAIVHKGEGIKLVNRRLTDPEMAISDGNILAAMFMANIEGNFGRRESENVHLKGLQQMINLRGGFSKFNTNRQLQMSVCWVELSLTGKLSKDDAPPGDETTEMPGSPFSPPPTAIRKPGPAQGAEYFNACCEEFISCLEKFQSLAQARRAFPSAFDTSAFPSSACLSVSNAFKPGSPLHDLLSRPWKPRLSLGFRDTPRSETQRRLAILLYLHAMFWDYRYSPTKTDIYIDSLQTRFAAEFSDSIEALLCAMLNNGNHRELERPDIAQLVLRLIKVARRLSQASWKKVTNILMRCLNADLYLQCCEGDLDVSWDAEEIRREIMFEPMEQRIMFESLSGLSVRGSGEF